MQGPDVVLLEVWWEGQDGVIRCSVVEVSWRCPPHGERLYPGVWGDACELLAKAERPRRLLGRGRSGWCTV